MAKKALILPFLFLFLLVALSLAAPAAASRLPQQIFSPTPDSSGNIFYIVQAQDTCLSIALRFMDGDVNQLIQLNSLNSECFITEGQKLLLGTVQQPTSTQGPPPTATSSIPTPTPTPGNGIICVVLFDDINGNGRKDPGENPISGGAISISDREGLVSLTGTTVFDADPATSDEIEPLCFVDIPEGEYNISVGVPEGHNPTTTMNYPLRLKAGDRSILDFGAQISSAGSLLEANQGSSSAGSQRSPLLGIIGGLLLLGGIGLGVYLRVLKR